MADLSTVQRDGPVGIGGWLILPILGFIGTLAFTTFNLLQALSQWDGLAAIFSGASGGLGQLRLPIALSLLGAVVVLGSAVACLVYIVKKDARIVPVATFHYLVLAVAGLVDLWGDAKTTEVLPSVPRDPNALRDAARNVIAALIWIPYFHVSKRVRNTFASGRKARLEPASKTSAAAPDTHP